MNRCLAAAMLSLWTLAVLAEPPTTAALAGSWQPHMMAFAQVSARQQAVLSLPFAARVTALAVEPGASVAAGDELARFDAPLLRQHLAAWQQARREVVLARKRLQIIRKNVKEHAITRREEMTGKQAVTEAEGRSEQAWQTLAADLDLLNMSVSANTLGQQIDKLGVPEMAKNLGILRAPFAGVVTQRRAALGEQLAANEAILELEALDRVYLDAGVPEASLGLWQAGETQWRTQTAVITLQPVAGAPRNDPDSGLWLLRFEAGNPGLLLRDGAWVEVRHLGAATPVVWVPAAAVVSRGRKSWCIVQRTGALKPVEVQVGPASSDGRIPVLKGIKPGERVVTEGAYELLYRDLKELIKFVD